MRAGGRPRLPGRADAATMRQVKLGITLKLFLAILAASAAAAAAMAIATRLSFQSGFLGYLEQRDLQRVDTLTAKLAEEYRRSGGWDFIRGDYARLRALAIAEQPAPRLSVLDDSGGLVVGNPEPAEDAAVRAVVVDDRVVGWLARAPFRRLTSAADLNFQQEQLRSGWIIAALALALAALVALLLARLFLQPIKRLAEATHQLAAGAYDTRVAVRSGDELGRLAADFNRLAHVLEHNEKSRRRFMADVSHELRTPLSILKGELEALEDGVRPLSRESLGSLDHEVAALSKLIEDLYQLALSDVGALTYRKERIDAAPVLAEAVNAFAERLRERGIRLETGLAPAMVLADGDRLGQAFRNLLENSLRYTDPGGCVRVRARREGARVVFAFEDSAPGIAADAMSRLFERFYRVEASRNRARGGAGLGLAICRSIVEAHDGEIGARASPLGGLAVTIALPAAP